MCIAIYKPMNRVLKDHVITNSYYNNSDGAGFAAWTPEEGLVVKKGFFTLAEFLEAYEPYSGNSDKKAITLLHFRIATHGPINEDNCHPFVVECESGYKVAVIHNGVISGLSGYDTKTKSDTAHFVEAILAPAIRQEPKIWLNPAFQHVVENLIGWSKLALIDSDGNVALYNQTSGMWDSDCWLSNSSYQYIYRSTRGGYCGVGDYGYDYQGNLYGANKNPSPKSTTPGAIIVKENGERYTWEEWLEMKDNAVEKLQERGVTVDAESFPFGEGDTSAEAEILAQIAGEIAEAEANQCGITLQGQEESRVVTGKSSQLALIPRDDSPFLSRVGEVEGSGSNNDSGGVTCEGTVVPDYDNNDPFEAAMLSTLENEGGSTRMGYFELCNCRMCNEYREIYPNNHNVIHTPVCECT